MKQLIEKFFNINYDVVFKKMVDNLLGPTGAEIISWVCLGLATFLILRRRVTSVGLIMFLYLVAWCFAYIPGLLKIFRGY